MKKEKYIDSFLEKRLTRYDDWLRSGQISFSSRVVPVTESLEARQWVLPSEQALEILRQAASVAVQDCECRSHYRRCDHPLEVCFLLNDVADKFVSRGKARHVSISEAAEILKAANRSGLVHLSLYMPDHDIYALCSCCSCCCHDLQIIRRYRRKDLILHSEYIAATDPDACIHCGECVGRCFFGARNCHDEKMVYSAADCVGCGLCVTVCPVGATTMVLR
jgi:ferredoxin